MAMAPVPVGRSRHGTSFPRGGAFSFVLVLALCWAGPAALAGQVPVPAAPAGAPASPARLLSGPVALRGLPFFSPNAIRALRGEYRLGSSMVILWSCRDTLVFGPSWKALPSEGSGRLAVRILARDQGSVLALAAPGYTLFFELPADSATFRRFALALESRFSIFFDSAPTDAELSFPAFVSF